MHIRGYLKQSERQKDTYMNDITRLIEAIRDNTNGIPVEIALWDTTQIARYLRMSVSEVRDHVTHLPDFPTPIRFQSRTGRLGHPRWTAVEVIKWAHSQKHGR